MSGASLLPATLGEETAQLLATFYAVRSGQTLRAYRRDLEDFQRFLGAATPQDAVETLLSGGMGQANGLALRYRAHLLERGLTPATVNRRLSALRSLVKLGRTLGLVAWSLEISQLRSEPYRDTRGPGRDGIKLLLLKLDEDGDAPRTRRDRAILRLLYDIGLRRGEVVSLDVNDVDLATGSLLVRGKGRLEKTPLSLPASSRKALAQWQEVHPLPQGSSPLFVSLDRSGRSGRLTANWVYETIRELGERAGIRVTPHGLRHTAITEACKAAQAAGIGLEEVLQFSRHRDLNVLLIYRDQDRNVQGQLAALITEEDDTL